MLRRIIEAHGGTLPSDHHVLFANTGKEHEETLDFVEEVSQRWSVPIRWVEWRSTQPFVEEVTHATAARNGEPFKAMIEHERYMPNPARRLCTKNLKILTKHRFFVHALRIKLWTDVVGMRYDEPKRVADLRAHPGAVIQGAHDAVAPLADAGVTLADVLAFWRAQPFDLRLEQGEGNCDECFMKTPEARLVSLRKNPARADWWAAIERERGMQFVRREPSYEQLKAMAIEANVAGNARSGDLGIGTVDCGCTD